MAEQKCLQMAAWHEGGQGCRPCRAGKRDTQALLLDPCSPPAPRNHDSGASGVGRPLNTAVSPLRAPEDPRGPCLQQDRWPARAGSSRSPAGAMIGSGGGQPEARPGGGWARRSPPQLASTPSSGPATLPQAVCPSPGHGVGHLQLAFLVELEGDEEGVEQGPVLPCQAVARQAQDQPVPLELRAQVTHGQEGRPSLAGPAWMVLAGDGACPGFSSGMTGRAYGKGGCRSLPRVGGLL